MRPHLSIVTSLYQSELTVAEFIERAAKAAAAITDEYEIVLVNDGSRDRTREIALQAMQGRKNIKLVDLSRNCGQLNAVHAGLTRAAGNYIFVLDSDLEEAPELVRQFYDRIVSAPDIDVVFAVQTERRDPLLRRVTSNFFYWFFAKLTGIQNLKNMLILRIMTRRFLDAYLTFGDYHLFVAGLTHQAGFGTEAITVDKSYKGHSTYSFAKRLTVAGDAILSYSTQPLYFVFYSSLVSALILLLVAVGLLFARLFGMTFQAGWASLVVSIWLVGAIIVNAMAMIGLYIAKIFEQVKGRPRYVVRHIYQSDAAETFSDFNSR